MWTEQKVKDKVKELNCKLFNSASELRQLATILNADENIINIFHGTLKNVHNANGSLGIFVVTDRRAIFLRVSIIGRTTTEQYALNAITSVSMKKGIINADVVITVAGNNAIFNTIVGEGKKLLDILSNLIYNNASSTAKNNANSTLSNTNSTSSISDELAKLADLYKQGILSEQEFTEAKQQVLRR